VEEFSSSAAGVLAPAFADMTLRREAADMTDRLAVVIGSSAMTLLRATVSSTGWSCNQHSASIDHQQLFSGKKTCTVNQDCVNRFVKAIMYVTFT